MTTKDTSTPTARSASEDGVPRAARRATQAMRPRRRGRVATVRDRIVMTSMGIVTAALAAALYTQLGLSAPSAVLAGAAAWTVFMLIHNQVQKSYEIEHLQYEVRRLEGQLRGSADLTDWPAAERDAAPVEAQLPRFDAADEGERAAAETRVAELTDAILNVAEEEATAAASTSAPDVAATAPQLHADPRWEPQAPRDGLFGQPLAGTNAAASQAAREPRSVTAAPSVQATIAPPTDEPPMDTALWPGTSLSAADPMREQWAFRPRTPAGDEAATPTARQAGPQGGVATVETDLAMVQSRIKALAEEVNASEALRQTMKPARPAAALPDMRAAPKPDTPETAEPATLESSIGALRKLAAGMKTPRYVEPPSLGSIPAPSAMSDRLAAAIAQTGEPTDAPLRPAPSGFGDLKIPSSATPIAASGPPQPDLPSLPELPFPPFEAARHGASPATLGQMPSLPLPPAFGAPMSATRDGDRAPSFAGPVFEPIADATRRATEHDDSSAFDFDLSGLTKFAQSAPEPSPHIRAIAEAIESGRMDVYLSPIVGLADHAITHYEVSMRLKSADGADLDGDEDEIALAGDDIVAMFDISRLNRAAQLAAMMVARGKTGALLSEVAGRSLTDAGFRASVDDVRTARPAISSQLVLTLSQAALENLTPSGWDALADLRAFGFRFALDRVVHLDTDFAALAAAGFAFAKIDARILLDGLANGARTMEPHEVCRTVAGAGLAIVAGGICDDRTSAQIFGFGVLLGQGQLFGSRLVNMPPAPNGNRSAAA